MKLPNGYGSICKLKGKRRRPWIAKVTKGWDVDVDKGACKPIYGILGYFETRQEALQVLADYNQDPYDINSAKVTFAELYEKWSKEHFKDISESRQRGCKSAFSKCAPLHRMKFKDIKTAHLEAVIDNCDVGQATKQHIKTLFNQLYKYALKHDVVKKDYSALMDPVGKYKREKNIEIFTTDEVNTLWENKDIENVDMILVGIYSGWRPSELTELETTNIDFENGTMLGGIKTENGIDRFVPIHPDIISLLKERTKTARTTLFNMNYEQYRYAYSKIMKKLGMKHKPHETRHTFVSKAKEVGVDEYCLKLIVGHSIDDLTERVYTHRQIEQLKSEMDKIKY